MEALFSTSASFNSSSVSEIDAYLTIIAADCVVSYDTEII
jgi:hypothetical protein